MRALVLGGAGAVCKETTIDLARYSDFDEIIVADHNLVAVTNLLNTIDDKRLTPLFFDATQYNSMIEHFPNYDIVINGLPFKYDYMVNKACVEAGVNGLDLSSDDPQFELHEEALSKDMIFIPGVGATPGITNIMVRRASEILDRINEVEVFFAAFRCLAPAPGLLLTTLWEFNPEEEDRAEVFYEDGIWHPTPPLSGEITIRFHDQIGEQKVYYVPHDEVNTLPHSFPEVRRVAVRGCFPPHVMSLMGSLMQGGLLSSRPVKIDNKEIPTIEIVRTLLADSPISRVNPIWGYGLVVDVLGERTGRQVRCTYRSSHPPSDEWGGEAAYFKNVGIPLSIGAQLIASGKITARGVVPPEKALPTDLFFNGLTKRGIEVEEYIVEEGKLSN